MIKRLLNRLKCRLGHHRMLTYPVLSIALANHRQVIVTKSCCTRCGFTNEFH